MFSIETITLQSKNGINIVLILYNNDQYMGGALKTQISIPFEQQILFYVLCHDRNGCHNRHGVSCHNEPSAGCLLMKK